MIKIAVVEDEKSQQALLTGYLERFSAENNESFNIVPFSSGLDFLNAYTDKYDIVFMDIEMPDLNGMEAARHLRKIDADAILFFVTNMANYAIKGYEVDALYFFVKPVQYYSFSAKMKKAIHLRSRASRTVAVRLRDDLHFIRLTDIYYVEVVGNHVTFHTEIGDFQELNALREVEKSIDDPSFARCNACYLVNFRYLSGIKDDMAIVHGEQLKISRSRKKEFMNAATKFLAGEGGGVSK